MNLFDAIFSNKPTAKPAVSYEQKEITYGDLREQTLRMSSVFDALRIPGDRVAFFLNDLTELIASFSHRFEGSIAVPINMGLRLDEQS